LFIANSTFSGNSAVQGGALWSDGSEPVILSNSTFSGNIASQQNGGAIYNDGAVKFQNTIFANNTGGNCYSYPGGGTLTDAGYNLADDSSCSFTQNTSTVTTTSAINLGSLSSNGGVTQTIPLLYPSVAIDPIPVGTNGCGQSPDQRGVFRPQGTACDIGAYEANQIPVAFATNPANLSYTVGSTNYTAAAAPFLIVGA
jgi:predicted outer membrane repeat protein